MPVEYPFTKNGSLKSFPIIVIGKQLRRIEGQHLCSLPIIGRSRNMPLECPLN